MGSREVRRRQERVRAAVAAQVAELRSERGVTLRALATAAGVDHAHLARVEKGRAAASLDVLIAIAANLGADVSLRLFPTAGPRLRDRLQAPMIEALVRRVRPPWHATAEVPVPDARGVIDLLLRNPTLGVSIACEAHSQLRSVDLVLRRLHEKTLGLARIDGPRVAASSLLLVRSTEATRRVVRLHEATLAATFPGSVVAAIDALAGRSSWPGPTLLWVRLEGGQAELLERAPRGIAVGR